MTSGQVIKCGHCKGSGTCGVTISCKACVVKAGLDPKETWLSRISRSTYQIL